MDTFQLRSKPPPLKAKITNACKIRKRLSRLPPGCVHSLSSRRPCNVTLVHPFSLRHTSPSELGLGKPTTSAVSATTHGGNVLYVAVVVLQIQRRSFRTDELGETSLKLPRRCAGRPCRLPELRRTVRIFLPHRRAQPVGGNQQQYPETYDTIRRQDVA